MTVGASSDVVNVCNPPQDDNEVDENNTRNILNDCNDNNSNLGNNKEGAWSDDTLSNGDDTLEPIERLQKYCCSEIIFHR